MSTTMIEVTCMSDVRLKSGAKTDAFGRGEKLRIAVSQEMEGEHKGKFRVESKRGNNPYVYYASTRQAHLILGFNIRQAVKIVKKKKEAGYG